MEDGTIWACSQNPLKHNTQHMALRHTERLSKCVTPILAYVTDTLVRYPSSEFWSFAVTFRTQLAVVKKTSAKLFQLSYLHPLRVASEHEKAKESLCMSKKKKKMHLSERIKNLKAMQLKLKIESNYQPSPQKKAEEKRREGEFIWSDCTF